MNIWTHVTDVVEVGRCGNELASIRSTAEMKAKLSKETFENFSKVYKKAFKVVLQSNYIKKLKNRLHGK